MNKENNKIFDNLASKEKKFRKKQLIIIVSLILFVTFLFIFMTFNTENKDKSITEKQNINNLSENQKDSNYDCVNDDKDSIYCLDRQNSMNLIQEISQDIEILKKRNAQIWNKDLFDRTIESFDIGSRSFKLNKFKKSIDDLNITSSMSKKLIYESDRIFNEGLDFGFKFLSEEKPELALEKFLEAQLIKNDDPKVLEGLFRAKVYPQILKLIKDANSLMELDELDKAQLIINKALILNKDHLKLKVFSKELSSTILERDFLNAIKSGNQAIVDKNPPLGISSFSLALKLKPNSLLAERGLNNIKLIEKKQKINSLLTQAKDFELNEAWSSAFNAYQSILLEDNNITMAKEGYERVKIITNLKNDIENILSRPNRLSDSSIRNNAALVTQKADILSKNFYSTHKKEMSNFINISTKLKDLISKMSGPINVRFVSDNKTSLIIKRIGSFEPFNEKFILLRPGKYEVYARRRGFKEKRIILEIDNSFKKSIGIICDERI
jgi:hypothetical protein